MRFKLFYFANPHGTRIHLRDVRDDELPSGVPSYSDYSDQAQEYLEHLKMIPGVEDSIRSHTAAEITLRKHHTATWRDIMPHVLVILRDRFAPGQPIAPDMLYSPVSIFSRALNPGDYTGPPEAKESQQQFAF